jgi:hypothetical protein
MKSSVDSSNISQGLDTIDVNYISEAFTDVLATVSNDANIIRQLSSLQIASGIKSKISDISNDENMDPNSCGPLAKNAEFHQTDVQKNMIQQLNGIHKILSQVESKLSSMSLVLQEEQAAMKTLQHMKESALGQKYVIKDIRQNLEDQDLYDLLPGNGLLKMGFQLDSLGLLKARRPERNVSMESAATKVVSMSTQQGIDSSQPVSSLKTPSSKIVRKMNRTPGANHTTKHDISIRFISQDEFYSISRNIRGRITLSALNEALLDIQRVTENKYNILHHSSRKMSSSSQISYQETCALHKEMLHNLIQKDVPFVTEQELRDSCAFFRSGESTARAILQILRSCKRIKQVFLGNCGVGLGSVGVGVGAGVGDRANGSLVAYIWLNAAAVATSETEGNRE